MSQLAASRSAFSSRSSVTSRQSAASAAVGIRLRRKTASAAATSLPNGAIGVSAGLHEGSFASQRGRGGLGRLTSLLIRMPAILVRSGNPCQRRRSTIPYVSPDEAGARSVVRRRPSRRQGVDCLRTRGLHRVPTLLYGLTLGCYPCPASPTHSRRGRQTSRKSSDDAHALLRAAYHVLADHVVYRELGADYYDRQAQPTRHASRDPAPRAPGLPRNARTRRMSADDALTGFSEQ